MSSWKVDYSIDPRKTLSGVPENFTNHSPILVRKPFLDSNEVKASAGLLLILIKLKPVLEPINTASSHQFNEWCQKYCSAVFLDFFQALYKVWLEGMYNKKTKRVSKQNKLLLRELFYNIVLNHNIWSATRKYTWTNYLLRSHDVTVVTFADDTDINSIVASKAEPASLWGEIYPLILHSTQQRIALIELSPQNQEVKCLGLNLNKKPNSAVV